MGERMCVGGWQGSASLGEGTPHWKDVREQAVDTSGDRRFQAKGRAGQRCMTGVTGLEAFVQEHRSRLFLQ